MKTAGEAQARQRAAVLNVAGLILACVMLIPISAHSQTPAATPQVWTGNFGAGLALTNGNTDTRNFNVSFGVVRDPKARSVLRSNGLYLRGDSGDKLIANQMSFV